MPEITVERWQEIERDVLGSMDESERNRYIRSMVNWAKRRELTTSRIPTTDELVEVGDVVFADFGVAYNMEIGYPHLGIVVSILRGKAFIVPLTSNMSKVWKDNVIEIKCDCLEKESVALCNDAKFINTARVIKRIGKAKEHEWRRIKNYVLKGLLLNEYGKE